MHLPRGADVGQLCASDGSPDATRRGGHADAGKGAWNEPSLLALRNAMSLVAVPPRMNSTNARAALVQLVRDMALPGLPIARPVPVSSFQIPPRPCTLTADWGRTPILAPTRFPSASQWPRRFAMAAGVAAALFLAQGWLEAFTWPEGLTIHW